MCCVGAGYGHVAPKTKWGRLITIVYALVGIPLTFLYLSNMGNFMAKCFRLFYQRVSMTPISHRSCCDCDFITDTWPRPAESVCASGWCPTVRLSVRLSVPSYFPGVNLCGRSSYAAYTQSDSPGSSTRPASYVRSEDGNRHRHVSHLSFSSTYLPCKY